MAANYKTCYHGFYIVSSDDLRGVVGVGPPQLHQYISKTHVRACEKYTKKSSDPHSSFFYKYITDS